MNQARRRQVEGPEKGWYDQIKELTPARTEPEVLKAIAQKQAGVITLNDGCITWQGKLYVSEIPELHKEIINGHHNGVTMGHPGQY